MYRNLRISESYQKSLPEICTSSRKTQKYYGSYRHNEVKMASFDPPVFNFFSFFSKPLFSRSPFFHLISFDVFLLAFQYKYLVSLA